MDDLAQKLPWELWVKIFDACDWDPAVALCFRVPVLALPAIHSTRSKRYIRTYLPMHAWSRPFIPRVWVHPHKWKREREWRLCAHLITEQILIEDDVEYQVRGMHALATIIDSNNRASGRRKSKWNFMARAALSVGQLAHFVVRYIAYVVAFNHNESMPDSLCGSALVQPYWETHHTHQLLRLCLAYVTFSKRTHKTALLELVAAAACCVNPKLLPHIRPDTQIVQSMNALKLPSYLFK
mgnify:CR=1 FL=1